MNRNERRTVTVGVIGNGEVSHELVCDALNRHFFMGPEDGEGYFGPSSQYKVSVVLPVSEKHTGRGMTEVWQWAMRCELPLAVLLDGEVSSPELGAILDTAEEDNVVEVEDIGEALLKTLTGSDNPILLAVSTEGQYLEGYAQAVCGNALRAGITVLDVGRVLRELDWSHLPDEQEPAEEGELVEEGGQTALFAVADVDQGPELTLSAEEVRILNEALEDAADMVREFRSLLSTAEDVAKLVVRAKSVLAPRPDPEPEAAKRQYLLVFDPKTNEWRKKGRGRLPVGAQAEWVLEDGTRVPHVVTEG
jgi:hypothetical protein